MPKYYINSTQVTEAEAKQWVKDGFKDGYYDHTRGYKVVEANGKEWIVGHYEERDLLPNIPAWLGWVVDAILALLFIGFAVWVMIGG